MSKKELEELTDMELLEALKMINESDEDYHQAVEELKAKVKEYMPPWTETATEVNKLLVKWGEPTMSMAYMQMIFTGKRHANSFLKLMHAMVLVSAENRKKKVRKLKSLAEKLA
jgi:N-acetylmuramic acid 6-phosphate (MurNAc-6-P) etherase